MKIETPKLNGEVELDSKQIIITVVAISLLISIIIARILSHSSLSLMVSSFLLIVAGIIGLIKLIVDNYLPCILYMAFLVISWFSAFALNWGNYYYSCTDFFNSIFFMGFAYILLTCNIKVVFFKILFYLVSLYFIIKIVVLNSPIRELLADGNSYNYISCYIVFFFVLYSIALLENDKVPGIIDSLIFVVPIVFSYGRGGIVTAIFYLMCFLLIKMHEKRTKLIAYAFVLLGFIILLFWYNKIYGIVFQNDTFEKFFIYGLNSNGRSEIWGGFLNKSTSSFLGFLTGSNPFQFHLDGNLHNSFLQMWSSMGIVFACVNILLLLLLLLKMLLKREWYYLMIIGTFLIRAFTDKMMFRWYGEIIMYFFVFCLFLKDYSICREKDNSITE